MNYLIMTDKEQKTPWEKDQNTTFYTELWKYFIVDATQEDDIYSQVRSLLRQGKTIAAIPLNFDPKCFFFDVDATLTKDETIELLAEQQGCMEQVKKITQKAMEGELDFTESLHARVSLLSGLSASVLDDLGNQMEFQPLAHRFTQQLEGFKIPFYMVSGGFNKVLEKLAKRLNANGYHGNSLEVREKVLTGRVTSLIVDGLEKGNWAKLICQEHNWQAEQDAVAFGDGANDIHLMSSVALGFGFNPKPILIPHIGGACYHPSYQFYIDFFNLFSELRQK